MVDDGRIEVLVRRNGKQPVFASASVTYQSQQAERMGALAEGIEVERDCIRIGEGGERMLVENGETLRVGELVEVELRLRGDGQPEFVHLRDPSPAGLEALVQSSGYRDGCYRESRTGETNLFFSRLHRWNSRQRYHLRAVTPGRGLALPARAECMYSPAISGQSGRRMVIVE
jgi:uncharacterized protein YfaS (alpha-2-macroglobulin family)